METPPPPATRWHLWLAIGSWLPLLPVLYFSVFPADAPQWSHFAPLYGATILCFLGGVRFGAILNTGGRPGWTDKIAPLTALAGFVALLLPAPASLALLVVGFGAQGALDVWAGFHGRLPQSYVAARTLMTWLFTLTLLAILVLSGRI